MSAFPQLTITNAGLAMIAITHNGVDNLCFTEVAFGDGLLGDNDDIKSFSTLKNECIRYPINSVELANNFANIKTLINNANLEQGFYCREYGIYARNSDGEPRLYGYSNAGDKCDYWADKSQPMSANISIKIYISDALKINAKIDQESVASLAQLERLKRELLSTMLPIGSIIAYYGDLERIPAGWVLCDGRNGTPNLIGRVLQGVNSAPGQYLQPGLPSINVGGVNQYVYPVEEGEGCFYLWSGYFQSDDYYKRDNAAVGTFSIATDPIYGRSSTVQPPAFTVFYIMRIA